MEHLRELHNPDAIPGMPLPNWPTWVEYQRAAMERKRKAESLMPTEKTTETLLREMKPKKERDEEAIQKAMMAIEKQMDDEALDLLRLAVAARFEGGRG